MDNGVSAHEEIAHANSLGIDVVVTDHHQPRETLPDAVAVVDPHRPDCPSPFKGLSGVGVAFKLVCALEGDEFMEKGDAGRLEIVTLRDAVGNKKLNDLAYQYDLLLLSIVEHQSTWSENMPLRELAYLGRTYEMNRDEAIQNAVHSCEFLFSSLFASGGRRKGLLR